MDGFARRVEVLLGRAAEALRASGQTGHLLPLVHPQGNRLPLLGVGAASLLTVALEGSLVFNQERPRAVIPQLQAIG